MDEKIRYQKLLQSPQWRDKRVEILKRDKACRSCGTTNNLHVHHRQYHTSKVTNRFVSPWKYNSKYLITLCAECHKIGHFHYQIPVKFI